MLKGAEPLTLQSNSPDFPTTKWESLSFLMKLGGINLSKKKETYPLGELLWPFDSS